MSTEKIIKNHARGSLSGNWSSIIIAVLFFCAVILLVDCLVYLPSIYFKIVDTETGNFIKDREWIFNIINLVAYWIILFFSPIINGIYRMAFKTADCGKTELTDAFYYFKGIYRYFKTTLINLFLICTTTLLFYVLDVYRYATILLDSNLKDGFKFDIITLVLVLAMAISVILKVLVYIVFVHYPLIAYAEDENKSVVKYAFGYIGFALRNLWKTIKLIISFIGWIALCFFVVPAFYVLPYILVSMSYSAKWLFTLDRNRG